MARTGERKPSYPVTIYFSEEEYEMLMDRKRKNGSSINRTMKQCLAMANKPSSLKLQKEIESLQEKLKARELFLKELLEKEGMEYMEIEVTEEQKEALQNEADERGLTLSDFVAEIISEGIAEKKEEKEEEENK